MQSRYNSVMTSPPFPGRADNGTAVLDDPVLAHARSEFVTLREAWTAARSVEEIRGRDLGDAILYFYVVDDDGRLKGVLPARRLLTAPPERLVGEMMIERVVTIPENASMMEALEFFILHKFYAFPVVSEDRRLLGVVDVGLFTEEAFDILERERMDEVYESIGFRFSQVRSAGPWGAFRVRFPWLVATLAGGTLCALLTSAFQVTLAKSLILAFFLTLVLGLGESVTTQSMTITFQALRASRPTLRWYLGALRREVLTGAFLGTASALAIAAIVAGFFGTGMPAIVIGLSVLAAMTAACLLGLTIPTVLHALGQDVRIAAGPLSLALADLCTLLIYFSTAAWLL
jgi:magnesium transporter